MFTRLPDELLVLILSQLQFRDILRCTLVCSRWKHIIDSSLQVQYQFELGVAGKVALRDNLRTHKANLACLLSACNVWKKENLKLRIEGFFRPQSVTYKVASSGDCVCWIGLEENPGLVHFVGRTSSSTIKYWSWCPPSSTADDYIQFSISPCLGLFVSARTSIYEQDRLEVVLDVLSIVSGVKHPDARHPFIKFHSNDRDGAKFINQLGVYGDLVAVQLSSTYGASFVSSIRVYNWKSGEEVSQLVHSSPYFHRNKKGIVFLAKEYILTTSMQRYGEYVDVKLEIYRLEPTSRHVATFHMPKLSRKIRTMLELKHSCSEYDVNDSLGPIVADLTNARLLGVTIKGSDHPIDDMQQICTIAVPLPVFLRHESFKSAPGVACTYDGVIDIPWEAWGPKYSRLVQATRSSPMTYGWKIAMGEGIYDFNQADITRDAYLKCKTYSHQRGHSFVEMEMSSFTHPIFTDTVRTSLPYRLTKLRIPLGSSVILGEKIILWSSLPNEKFIFLSEEDNDQGKRATRTTSIE